MEASNPIGIFDSGVGGTSIWKEIHQLLPLEKTIYLADSKNAPYGKKPIEEIIALCKKNTELLLKMDCKLIVVACNTATTNAIKELRAAYSVPFIGIEPAIKPAALNSSNKTIGILATQGTLSSALFSQTSELYAKTTEIVEVVGNGLVELIESGKTDSEETNALLRELLAPMIKKGIDYLVLGCSHYPYLISNLKEILPEGVKIIDSGEAVARQTREILSTNRILSHRPLNEGIIPQFYSNGNIEVLSELIQPTENNYKVSYLDF